MATDNGSTEVQRYYIRLRGKVVGPFDVVRLKQLRDRGQFSRMHQISTDRRNWQSASTIESLFNPPKIAMPAESEGAESTYAVVTDATAPAEQASRSSGSNWYYQLADEQCGPVTLMQLRSLLSAGQLRPDDYVWKDGMADWMLIEDVPDLQPKSSASPAPIPSLPASHVFCFACGAPLDSRAVMCPKCGVGQANRGTVRSKIANYGGSGGLFAAVLVTLLVLLIGGAVAYSYIEGDAEAGAGAARLLLWAAGFVAFLFYFLPAFVAGMRGHHNTAAVFILNLLLGWTFLGWVAALVWAFTAVERKSTTVDV